MKPIIVALIVIITAVTIVACVPQEKQCSADTDCVPASCCHPTDAVNKAYGPDCRGQLCTLECEPNTLDCGQGEIKCINNKCQTIITNEAAEE